MGAPMKKKLPVHSPDAPLYRITQKAQVAGRIVGPDSENGDTAHFEGVPSKWMEPLNDAARKAVAERDAPKAAEKPSEAQKSDKTLTLTKN